MKQLKINVIKKMIKFIGTLVVLILLSGQAFSQENKQENKKSTELTWDEDWAEVDTSVPLFINGNNAKKDIGQHISWSSLILPFSAAIAPSYVFDAGSTNIKNGRSVGWIANLPIKKSFQILYGLPMRIQGNQYFSPFPISNSRTVFKNVDSSRLVAKLNGVIQKQNCYTIQLTAERNISEQQIRKKMISDLELCFGLTTGWEKQTRKCIVISRSEFPLTEFKEGAGDNRWGTLISINNIPMEEFVARMASDKLFFNSAYPIVDETGFKGRLGKINLEPGDQKITYDFLSKTLPKYGLKLSVEDRKVDILVISGTEK